MSYNWGPHFIVPSETLKEFSGHVQLREWLDEDLLAKELQEMGVLGSIVGITNPWYFRKKATGTWIKIGESAAKADNFPVSWDTTQLDDGEYEVLGLMHVIVRAGGKEQTIARQSIVDVTIKN